MFLVCHEPEVSVRWADTDCSLNRQEYKVVDGNQVEKIDQKTDAITRPIAMPNTGSVSGKSASGNRQLEWVNNGGLDDVTHG